MPTTAPLPLPLTPSNPGGVWQAAEGLTQEEGAVKQQTTDMATARHERDRELLAVLQHLRDTRDGLRAETAGLRAEVDPIEPETRRLRRFTAELAQQSREHVAKAEGLAAQEAECRGDLGERRNAHEAAMPGLIQSVAHCVKMQERCTLCGSTAIRSPLLPTFSVCLQARLTGWGGGGGGGDEG